MTHSPARMAAILGTIVAIGPLTIDMYLPALPSIADDLSAADATVQLTLTGTLVGLAVGQLLIGPLSDAVGRRRPLLYGLAVHVVASLLCLVAPTIGVLGTLRLIQGFGVAAASVIATAVVRDLYQGVAAARLMSRLMVVMGAAPVLAPSIGGQVLRFTNWRGVFVALAVLGVAIAVLAATALPETLPPTRRVSLGLASTVRGYATVLKDRSYVGLVLVTGLAFGAMFSYVAGSPFVLQEQYGLSKQVFGLAFGAGAVGLVLASYANVRLLERFTPRQVLIGALTLGLAASLVLVILATTGAGGLAGILVPLWIMLVGAGLAMPNAPALALSRHGEAAGTAAAVLGAVQFGVGALAAPVVGALGATSLGLAGGMALAIVVAMAGALAIMLMVVRGRDLVEAAAVPAQA